MDENNLNTVEEVTETVDATNEPIEVLVTMKPANKNFGEKFLEGMQDFFKDVGGKVAVGIAGAAVTAGVTIWVKDFIDYRRSTTPKQRRENRKINREERREIREERKQERKEKREAKKNK